MVGTAVSGPPGSSVSLSCFTQSSLSGEVEVAWQLGGIIAKTETVTGSSLFSFSLPSMAGQVWVQCLMQNEYGCDEEAVAIVVEEPGRRGQIFRTTPTCQVG